MKQNKGKKYRLTNFDFSGAGSHIALVDRAANAQTILVSKNLSPSIGTKTKEPEFNEQMLITLLEAFNATDTEFKVLTEAISKSENGAALLVEVEKDEQLAQMLAEREAFNAMIATLDRGAYKALQSAALVINQFLDNAITPDDELFVIPGENQPLIEKAIMKENQIETTENVEINKAAELRIVELEKAIADQAAIQVEKDAKLAEYAKAEETANTAVFIAKAIELAPLGIAEEDQTDFGMAMKTLSESNKDAYALIENLLTNSLNVVKNLEVFKEVGSTGETVVTDNEKRLAKAVAELVEATPSLTHAGAVVKAIEIDPTLASE